MKIEHLIAINFGALEPGDYLLGQANLISGKNGAGKSTLQDLIQIVLAGNEDDLIRLNPAQDVERRKRRHRLSRRTLAAYAVNMSDDGPGRPAGAISIIGLAFQPDADEDAKPFTALWCADVGLDGGDSSRPTYRIREEYGVLIRRTVYANDLLQDTGDGGFRLRSLLDLKDYLGSTYPSSQIELPGNKTLFTLRLHHWISGGEIAVRKDAARLVKSFVQSISLRDIDDVDTLVRERVLDHMDMAADVQETAATLRELDLLQRESERLSALSQLLETMANHGLGIRNDVREGVTGHLASAIFQRRQDQGAHADAVSALTQQRLDLTTAQARQEDARQHRERLEQALGFEQGRADNRPALAEQRDLQRQINDSGQQLRKQRAACSVGIEPHRNESTLAHHFSRLKFDDADPLARHWAQLREPLARFASRRQAVARRLESITPASSEQDLDGLLAAAAAHDAEIVTLRAGDGLPMLQALALDAFGAAGAQRDANEADIAQVRADLARVNAGQALVPRAVNHVLAILRREMPQARPVLLCDVVRPVENSNWQNAIEGLLGGARFTILVDPEHEARAHLVLKREHRQGAGAPEREKADTRVSIGQLRRAQEDSRRRPLSPRSILSELEFDDARARDYLSAKYGSTLKVTDAAELDTIASGLMSDGRMAKSYDRRIAYCEKHELFFGATAQQTQRDLVVKRATDLARKKENLERNLDALKWLCATPVADGLQLLQPLVQQLGGVLRQAHALHEQLARLGIDAENREIVESIRRLSADVHTARTDESDAVTRVRALNQAIQQQESRLPALVAALEAATLTCQLRREWLQEVLGVWSDLEEVQAAEQEADVRAAGGTAPDATARVAAAGRIAQQFQAIQGLLDQYLARAREGEGIERHANVLPDEVWSSLAGVHRVLQQIAHRQHIMQATWLRENAEKISATKHSFASVLTDTLVQKILSKVREIDYQIKTLNRPLADLSFGTHRKYQIVHTPKQEFAEYIAFFEAVRSKAQQLSPADQWFGKDVFTAEEHATRERIKGNLLASNTEAGRKELERLGNAANYFEYDLHFETINGTPVSYAEWGTGSGGENATPPYILCAMILANACGWFRSRGPRLRVLMLDEAFKVHDLERSNRVIEYLQRMGFQLIIAAQREKATSILPNFTTTLSVTRLAARRAGRATWVSNVHTIGLDRDPLRAMWESRREQVARDAQAAFDFENPLPAASDDERAATGA